MENIKNKIIIRNYTDKTDLDVIEYVNIVISEGKKIKTNGQMKYPLITVFEDGTNVGCNRKNNTNTFYIY